MCHSTAFVVACFFFVCFFTGNRFVFGTCEEVIKMGCEMKVSATGCIIIKQVLPSPIWTTLNRVWRLKASEQNHRKTSKVSRACLGVRRLVKVVDHSREDNSSDFCQFSSHASVSSFCPI